MEENFARTETKYLVTVPQAEALGEGLRRMGFERLCFGSPKVQRLYYDTPDHRLIRTSLERPAYKEKLRLRAYGEPGALAVSYTEIKKKYRGVVYKRRVSFPLDEAMAALRTAQMPAQAGQVGREAEWMVRHYGLVPAAVIAYDRDAWFHPSRPGVRITFDRNLSFRDRLLNLNETADNLPILPAGERLMEIKTGGTIPMDLARLLNRYGVRRCHFSKYGRAYRMYIRPGVTERSQEECSTVFLPRGA